MVQYVIKKPFGIAVLMALLGFIGGLGSFASIGIIFMSIFGDGPYRMNGDEVSKAEFLRFLVPFMAVYFPMCLLAFAAAWSIHTEHPRSRPLLLSYLSLPILFGPAVILLGYADDVAATVLPLAIFPVVGWLYLYRKRTVSEYYNALVRRED